MKTKKNKGGAVWNVLNKGVNKNKECYDEYKDYYGLPLLGDNLQWKLFLGRRLNRSPHNRDLVKN